MRHFILSLLVALAPAGLLCACAAGGAMDPGAAAVGHGADALSGFEHPGRVATDADLAAPPEIGNVSMWVMGDVWRTDIWPPLFQGAQATVSMSPDRASACGPDATVTGYLATPDGTIITLPMGTVSGGSLSGTFQVPAGVRSLSLWVTIEGPDGCVAYDSDYGRNYQLPVYRWAPGRVRFDASGAPVADGPLMRGGVIVVDYALARLSQCRETYEGFPAWDLIAHAAFDGAEVPGESLLLSGATNDGTFPAALAYFPIPWDASEAQLWFENNENPNTCVAWDSNHGANYRFALSPMDATPPAARLVFAPGWVDHATGPLYGGATVTIEAAAERFPACGVSGEVTAGLRTATGDVLTARLDGWTASGARQGQVLLPPGAGHIELWLHATRADGCDAYDSNYGVNYGFDVTAW
jgi:hypothetical protein